MPTNLQIVPFRGTIFDMKSSAETPIAFIKTILNAYEQRGIDSAGALQATQIAPSFLNDPNGRITASQLENFTEIAMRELQDEALGWFSKPLPWGTHGLLCRATLPSANLRVALIRWCRYHGLLVEDIGLKLEVTGEIATLTIHENRDLGPYREFCLVTTFRNIHGFACWLADSRIPLIEAQFPHPKPPHASAYDVMFRAPVRFSARQASLSFNASYLRLVVRRNDDDLRQMLLRPLPLIVLQYRRDRLLSQLVRQAIRTRSLQFINAATLASELNVSIRSLHRHLADEGMSLQKIKNEVRLEIAADQLTRTDRPIKQVAASASFRNEASFIRAFRQWTGSSPGEFRRLANQREIQ